MPDLHTVAFGQCLPRYRYVQQSGTQANLLSEESKMDRVDNITDTALARIREHYGDYSITKDDIFYYIYSVLHVPDYRKRFANDLSKELPRIPFVTDFRGFADAGYALAELHLSYETCNEFPLETVFGEAGEPRQVLYRLTERSMKFADNEKSELKINEHITVKGIPFEAHLYQVNGRTPLEWFIDRYRITRDSESGIVNDPNEWFEGPRDLVTAIQRVVYLSVATSNIVKSLPPALNSG